MKTIKSWKQLLNDPRVESVNWEDNEGETSGGKVSKKDVWITLKAGWKAYGECGDIHEWSKGDAINELNNTVFKG